MKKSSLATILCAIASAVAMPSQAAQISYSLQGLGGNEYRYDYSVLNDGSTGGAVGLFDILFDPALYDEASLTISSDPSLSAAWDQQVLASAPGVPAAFDVLATQGGIAVGDSLSGFSMTFNWLGTGQPGAQGFEIYDPESFALLQTGTTSPVPLPGTLGLLACGIGGLLLLQRRSTGTCR